MLISREQQGSAEESRRARASLQKSTGLQLWALPTPCLVTRSHVSQSTNQNYKPLMTSYAP